MNAPALFSRLAANRPKAARRASVQVGSDARHFSDRRHHLICRRLVDHVAVFWNPVERTLRNLRMQSGGLSIDVDQAVLLACNNYDRHLQIRILVLEVESVRNHERRFRGRRPDLRRTESHLLWKYFELPWYG